MPSRESSELEQKRMRCTTTRMPIYLVQRRSCSIIEFLNRGLERGLLQIAEEVRAYLAEEKASWNR